MLTDQKIVDFVLEEEFGFEYVSDDRLTGIDWAPFPDSPQSDAYLSEADELFYGGQAGGGKTDLALGLAGTAHKNSLIMRRVFPSMRSMIERSRVIYNTFDKDRHHDSYNESLHVWRLGSVGRMVEFGSLVHSKVLQKYRGRPFDFYAFDEITEFTESMYRFLIAWNRSEDPDQRCRVVCTGNPPSDIEGEWVIKYWAPWLDPDYINPAEPGELRWFMTIDGIDTEVEKDYKVEIEKGVFVKAKSRTFIPAKLSDNPVLMKTNYMATLNATPEPLRSQLLFGDFGLKPADDDWQVIPTQAVLDAQKRFREGERPELALKACGLDVARGGADNNVLAKLYGSWFDPLEVKPGVETPRGWDVSYWALDLMETNALIGVDAIGNGAGVIDALELANADIIEIVASEGSDDTDQTGRYGFKNVRSQMWWQFREALLDADQLVALPDDREIRVELCAPRFKVVNGQYQIESKPDIKKRIGRSTDKADAIIQAWYTALYADVNNDEVHVW